MLNRNNFTKEHFKNNLKLENILLVLEITSLFLGVFTTFLFYSHFEKIMGNSASRFLLVLGPYFKIGRPYTDLWEFVPPGFLAVSNLWIYLFGWGMDSFKMLQIALLLISGLSFLLILRKIFVSSLLQFMIFLSFVVVFYSPILQTDMLSIDLFGATFSLLGLVMLLYVESPVRKIFASALFFFLASQMKETLAFTVISIVPYYLNFLKENGFRKSLKLVLSGFLGALSVAMVIALYISSVDAWSGYRQILEFKVTQVQSFGSLGSILAKIGFIDRILSEKFLHWHNYLRNLIVLNVIILFYKKYIYINIKKFSDKTLEFLVKIDFLNKNIWVKLSACAFSLGIFLGLIMYGQFSVDVRMVPVVPAFLILVGILLCPVLEVFEKFVNAKINNLVANIIILFLLFVFLSPQINVVRAFAHEIRVFISVEFKKEISADKGYIHTSTVEINKYIEDKTTQNDCIINPYGWEVAETYIYSHRKPCSRHFLANLLINQEWQIKEYKRQILDNPPSVIVYNINMIDLNLENFAKKVLNYPIVIKHCYTPDKKYVNFPYLISGSTTYVTLYWKRTDLSENDFKNCFRNYSKSGDDLGEDQKFLKK